MAYIVTSSCIDVKDGSCVEVCPVDSIYEGPRMMYINIDECVDCGRCESVCPTMSIYYEDDLPEPLKDFYKINVEVFEDIGSPGGARKLGPLAKDHPLVETHAPDKKEKADAAPASAETLRPVPSPQPVIAPAPVPAAENSDSVRSADSGSSLEVDVAIIGAGPVGLYAAYYAGFRGLSSALIDSLPQAGGQCAALYPEKEIFDIAGFPAVKGQELINGLIEQASKANPSFVLGERAELLDRDGDHWSLTTSKGTQVKAKAILIAGGIGNFTPRELPVGRAYEGKGLRYFVPRLNELSGQDVVIVGGGDSAVDWATALEPIAKSVTLVHRRDSFRAHEQSVQDLRASSVRILTPYEVTGIFGDDAIESVELTSTTGESLVVQAQSVVVAIGFLADLGPLEKWGLQLRKRHIHVDRYMQTNLPGVFAAGDITDFDGKIRILSVGFAEAAIAINHIAPLVNSELSTNPGHSSHVAA